MALVPRSFTVENITLHYNSFTLPKTGEVWVTANDIAKSMGYKNPAKAIKRHVKDPNFKSTWSDLIEGSTVSPVGLSNWKKNTVMINEAGIYLLIFSCRFKHLNPFRDWVCGTVLPSIRKTGRFFMDERRQYHNMYGSEEKMEAERALIESIKAQIEATRALLKSINDLENERKEAENKRKESEKARKEAVAMCHRIADAVQNVVVSKPTSRHALIVHELDSESKKIAFTRCQPKSRGKALKRLFHKNPQARELYKTDCVPNDINVLKRVKKRLKKENIPYSAQRNIIKLLNTATNLEEVVNVIREVIASST